MSSSGEEEETGPSVDSADPEERIAARRIRIQRRREAQRRAQMGEDPNDKKEVQEELSRSRKQMEDSRNRLTKLQDDATEFVTNIRVAAHAREASRRIEEEEARRQRRERLEAEIKAGTEKFDEITRKWESSMQKEIPQDLHEMLMQQKAACDAMIDEKNKLINDFQVELKQKDDHYVKDLKKQAEDIDLMIERNKEQVKNLTKSYREELNEIERSFVAERNELLELQRKRWDQSMQSRRDKELEYMHNREKRVEDYEQQLQHLRVQDAEEYNMVKIKLETDVQILEQQLQQMRATYQLNQEKLEYNFQVLKKRDEENTITKSQQKRKITRLQDVLTNLKSKLTKQEKQYRDENTQLSEDYKRITEQFRELQKKSKHFMSTDAKKFHDVWCMNEEEAKDLVGKVMEEDRIVHEQQLGLDWKPPDLSFMENEGPLTRDKAKFQGMSAHEVVQEVLAQADKEAGDDAEKATQKSIVLQKFSPKLVKQILELLCDESGFLIESKLNKLLQPLERDEQSLMKLDAIFTALKVETEDDIHQLANYFIQQQEKSQSATASSTAHRSMGVGPSQDGEDEQCKPSEKTDAPTGELEEEALDEEIGEVTGNADDGVSIATAKHDPIELIHPNEAVAALRQFVEDNRQPPKDKGRQAQYKIATLEERDATDDSEYWQMYPAVLPEKEQRLWDALLDGLEKYSEVLTSRSTLITETDSLQQQNSELRMLLHQYINSKVNQELEIPPTRVLQLELNQHR